MTRNSGVSPRGNILTYKDDDGITYTVGAPAATNRASVTSSSSFHMSGTYDNSGNMVLRSDDAFRYEAGAQMTTSNEQFEQFHRMVREQMRFLREEFGFWEMEADKLGPEMWVVLRNPTTEVSVHFEFASGSWVSLRRLDGDGDHPVDGFALEHLLEVRAPDTATLVTPKDFEPEAIERALRTQAALLKRYASDVLAGNFEIVAEVAKVRDADLAKWNAKLFGRS